MSFPNLNIDYGSFLRDEELKSDGSNFIDWYQRLRGVLLQNDLLYIIEEPLGDAPDYSASEDDRDEYYGRRDSAIAVQVMMLNTMVAGMRGRYQNTYPFEMVDELKTLFAPQVRLMKFECLNEFLSTKMEENTCLESHLANLHRIHRRLTGDLDYWMTDALAIDAVLFSLPPSYKDVVADYVMRGESFTFHEFLARLRTVKVKPIEGEVIDGEGIFDIQVINVFMLNTYSSFHEYLILIPVLLKT